MEQWVSNEVTVAAASIIGMAALLFAITKIRTFLLGDLPERVKRLESRREDDTKAVVDAISQVNILVASGQERSQADHAALRKEMTDGFAEAIRYQSEKRSDMWTRIQTLEKDVSALKAKT